ALQFINKNDIDLLILDLMMPFLDGFSVLNELKSSEKNKDIPVIVYSAVNEIDSIQRALELGAYDYLIKPLSKEQMSFVVALKVRNALKDYRNRKLLKEANERLEKEIDQVKYLSFHDRLTGLYNRTFLDLKME